MEDLIDLFVHKATSWRDWIEVGSKEEYKNEDENIKNIDVDISIGNVEVRKSKNKEIYLLIFKKLKSNEENREILDKRLRDEILVNIYVEDDTLYVKSDYEEKNLINKNIETSVHLYLPTYIEFTKIQVDIGNISVIDFKSNLKLEDNIGNIYMEKFEGSCTIRSGVGNIVGREVYLKDGSKVELGTGNINMKLLNLNGKELYIGSNIGNINLEIPKELDYSLAKKNILREKRVEGQGTQIVLESRMGKTTVKES